MKSGKKDIYFLQEVDDQLIYHALILTNMQERERETIRTCISVNHLNLSVYTSNFTCTCICLTCTDMYCARDS